MKSKLKSKLKLLEIILDSDKNKKKCSRPSCKNNRISNSLYCSKECSQICNINDYK